MKQLSRHQVLGSLLTVLVLAAIIGGLFLLGPPSEGRARQLDGRRVGDLTSTARALNLYWSRQGRLPSSMSELQRELGSDVRFTDPGTGEPYEYRTLTDKAYEVCARFDRDSPDGGLTADGMWSHSAGRQCFRREARKIG